MLSVVVVAEPVETVAPARTCPSEALETRPLIEAVADESGISEFSSVRC